MGYLAGLPSLSPALRRLLRYDLPLDEATELLADSELATLTAEIRRRRAAWEKANRITIIPENPMLPLY